MIDRGIEAILEVLGSRSRRICTQEWDVYKIVSVCFGFRGNIAVPVESVWDWVSLNG